MDLTGADITPAEGKLAVRFIDDDDDDDDETTAAAQYPSAPGEEVPYKGCLAIVLDVGPKAGTAKKGNIIVVSPWAKRGLKIGDDVIIIDSYSVQATLKAPK